MTGELEWRGDILLIELSELGMYGLLAVENIV